MWSPLFAETEDPSTRATHLRGVLASAARAMF